jgi:hypothetical protein
MSQPMPCSFALIRSIAVAVFYWIAVSGRVEAQYCPSGMVLDVLNYNCDANAQTYDVTFTLATDQPLLNGTVVVSRTTLTNKGTLVPACVNQYDSNNPACQYNFSGTGAVCACDGLSYTPDDYPDFYSCTGLAGVYGSFCDGTIPVQFTVYGVPLGQTVKITTSITPAYYPDIWFGSCNYMVNIPSAPVPAQPASIAGKVLVCPGETAIYSTATVANAVSYTWDVPPGATINSGQGTNSITVTFGNAGGDVCVTAVGTCASSTTKCKTIGLKSGPLVNLGVDKFLCPAASTTLDAANTGSTYLWSTNATTQTISVAASGTYTVTATQNGCTSTDAVVVTNLPPVLITNVVSTNLTGSFKISGGLPQQNGSNYNAVTMSLQGNAGVTAILGTAPFANNQTVSFSAPQAGTYQVVVTDGGGCIAIATVVLSNGSGGNGMAPCIEWQKSYGGSLSDNAYAIRQTADGGFIVTGCTRSNDGDVSGNHGNDDVWVIKISSLGALQWQKSFGGSNSEFPASIQQTIDGGYAIAGYTFSNNGDVSGNHQTGWADAWIIKLNNSGILQWQKTFGGTNSDFANSIEQTIDGGYIVAGYTFSNDGDVSGPPHISEADAWILKLNNSGVLQWQKRIGGSAVDNATMIRQTSDGGYIMTGGTKSNDGDVSGNHGQYDAWIVKLSNTGALQWQKTLGGTSDEVASAIQQTTDGGYVLAGYTNSNDGDVAGNHGLSDAWIIKLNSSGVLQWQKSFGGSDDDSCHDIQQTTDGGYMIGGKTNSTNGDVSGNHGGSDFWVTKLNASGNLLWQKSVGGSGNEALAAIQLTSDGGSISAGYADSNNGDITGNHGSYDFCVVKIKDCTPCTLVTNTNDSGPGSLRAAIDCANTNPGPDTIKFQIPGTTQHIIQPTTALPQINQTTIIDATTQAGWSLGNIVLDGSSLPGAGNGLLFANHSGSAVYGMTIRNFRQGSALSFYQCSNLKTGTPGKGNAIYGNSRLAAGSHLEITFQECTNVTVQANHIGVTENNTVPAGVNTLAAGIGMESQLVKIGGSRAAGEGNTFGNCDYGISCYDNTGNGFTPASYQILGNDFGISPTGSNITGGAQNAISVFTNVPQIQIGDGTADHQNRIAFYNNGVEIAATGSPVSILYNQFICNKSVGIECYLPDKPAFYATAVQNIAGTAPAGSLVEVYRSTDPSCPNAPCQGRDFLGSVIADASGIWKLNAPFATTIAAGESVTATSTLNGVTSQFADCEIVKAIDLCDPVRDRQALIEFYNSLGGPNWTIKTNWLTTAPLADWYGIIVDARGCVLTVDLDGNPYVGYAWSALPPGNNLQGVLPPAVGALSQLEWLSIAGNSGMHGTLPDSIGALQNLEAFYAHECNLNGPFPPSFFNLSKLDDCDLEDNPLNMSLSPDWGKLKKLESLLMPNCGLYGKIPSEMGQMDSLNVLGICCNNLTGNVPASFQQLNKLQSLQIEHNHLESLPDLSGVPFTWWHNYSAHIIYLDANRFTFDDILPNIPLGQKLALTYAPQDSVFHDTTLVISAGQNLNFSLDFDESISSNVYRWYKDGVYQPTQNQAGNNNLVINNLNTAHTGAWQVEVTNPNAPGLTLHSRAIHLQVSPVTTSCPVVTNTNDAGPGSFRAAIDCANTHPGPDTIRFNIPGTGPHIIKPLTNYPDITGDYTMLDATTQPGWVLGSIVLDGSNLTDINEPILRFWPASGTVSAPHRGAQVYGMVFKNAPGNALNLTLVRDFQVGAPGKENVFYETGLNPATGGGVCLQIWRCVNGIVRNNYFGIDQNLTPAIHRSGVGAGIWADSVQVFENQVGYTANGVSAFWPGPYPDNNYSDHISIYRNRIFNCDNGILVNNSSTDIQIGTDLGADENVITNSSAGIRIDNASNQVAIARNSFYCNTGSGIYYGTPAAAPAKPVIVSASTNAIMGTSVPGATVRVFAHGDAGCPTAPCQGKSFLGQTTANASGQWSLTGSFASGTLATVTATQNGITSEFSACMPVCNVSMLALGASSQSICAGQLYNLQLTLSGGAGPYNLVYNDGVSDIPLSNVTPTYNLHLAPTATTTYTFKSLTDATGCSTTLGAQTFTLQVNPLPAATASASIATVCAGQTISLLAGGGGTYAWSGPVGFSSSAQNPTRTNAATGMVGLYQVTVTNSNGCTATASTNINIVNGPTVTAAATAAPCGQGAGSITLTVNGGAPSFQYAWADLLGPGDPKDRTGLFPGAYTVIVTDANGCTTTTATTVVASNGPQATAAVAPAACSQSVGSITLTVSGGTQPYQYDWAGLGGTNDPKDQTGLAPGDYTVTITDASGCTFVLSKTVTGTVAPVAKLLAVENSGIQGDLIVCAGDGAIFVAGGGTQYQFWVNGVAQTPGFTNSNTLTLPVLPGNITVKVRAIDGNGCQDSTMTAEGAGHEPISLTVAPTPNLSAFSMTRLAGCPGDSVLILLHAPNLTNGTYDVHFNINNGTTQVGAVSFSSGVGILHIGLLPPQTGAICHILQIVTGPTGCAGVPASGNLTFNVPPPIQASLDTTLCAVQSLVIGGQTYSQAGVYTIHLKTGANCDSTLTLNLKKVPYVSRIEKVTICTGAQYVFYGTTLTQPGPYQHTASGTSGCDTLVQLTLFEQPPVYGLLNKTICPGTTFQLGDSIFTKAGFYQVKLKSALGCDSIVNVNLQVTPISIAFTKPQVKICAGANTNLAPVVQGCQGCQYKWNTGSAQQVLAVAPAATTTYQVSITSVGGCKLSDSVQVVIQPVYHRDEEMVLCPGDSIHAGGSLITKPGIYQFNFKTVAGCDSTVALTIQSFDASLLAARADTVLMPPDGSTTREFSVTGNDLLKSDYQITILEKPKHGEVKVISKDDLRYVLSDRDFYGIDSFQYALCPLVDCPEACALAWVYMRVQSGDIDKAKQLIPNAFIPTSSNTLNATFDPVQVLLDNAIIIQESELFIINRWGEIVLHQRAGSGASNPWDGAQNHHPLPMGTYYYKLRVLSGDTYLLQGPVNLMR